MSWLSGFASFDRAVTPDVRVRRFQHLSGRTAGPAGAHADVEIAWVEQGEITYRIGPREHVVGAGEAIVVPAEFEHATRVTPGFAASSVWLSRALLAEVASGIGKKTPDDVHIVSHGPFRALGGLLQAEAANDESGSVIATDALARAFGVALLRATSRTDAPRVLDPRIRAALDLLEERYAEPLSVDDLARTARTSRFHFSRLFREAVGKSPYRHLQETRLRRARELLDSGRMGVTEAAFSVGFNDLGRFSRAFRQAFGCSPSEVKGARSAERSARSA
jgi:AraC-like DNA-binding protein